MTIEWITIGGYFAFLLVLGWVFSRMNRNLSDYVRGGAQATWWLAGTSALMGGISAFTFTGNAAAAFQAGPVMLTVYLGNCIGLLLCWLFVAARLRQTRAFTTADIIRRRFGPEAEFISVLFGILLAPLNAAIQLWALATFASAVFGFPVLPTIIVIGLVVLIYSTSGGRWAVMATDFLQSLVLLPITLLLAYLALNHVGGWDGFLSHWQNPDIQRDFQWIKQPGEYSGDRFTSGWILAVLILQVSTFVSMNTAGRFLSVKDGREASRSALLSLVLMSIGAIVWVIPAIVARFSFEQKVLAVDIDNPAEAAYSIAALELLPNGMIGLMIIAMLAATMSSMDTGLNSMTGAIVRNLISPVRKLMKREELSDKSNVILCKFITSLLGATIISYALILATQDAFELFDAFLVLNSTIGLPLGIPLIAGLFIKRLPRGAYIAMIVICAIPSVYTYWDAQVNDGAWTMQERTFLVCLAAIVSLLVCIPFYRFSGKSYRNRVDELFRQMNTPVDFEKEIGENRDLHQLKVLGLSAMIAGGFLAILILLPNPLWGRLSVLFVAGFVFLTGLLLRWAAHYRERKKL